MQSQKQKKLNNCEFYEKACGSATGFFDRIEKELKSAGMKFNDGDYASRFISGVKAKTTQDDVDAGVISVSTALEKYKNSKQIDLEARLHKALRESDIFEDDEEIEDDIIEQTLIGHGEFGLADDKAEDAIEEVINAYNSIACGFRIGISVFS